MSSKHQLTVLTVDPMAEITVYDASFNRVGRDVGVYRHTHDDGLYEIRVRTAGTQETELISLAEDKAVSFRPIAFASPAPLVQTAASDEAHQAAVVRASRVPVQLGVGSGLLIVVRDRLSREPATALTSPAAGLSLIGPDGEPVFDVGLHSPVDSTGGSPIAAISLHVDPNIYRLRLETSEGRATERTLVASPHWTTECFMVRRPIREQLVVDLAQGSLALNEYGQPFAPDNVRTRLSEAARDALANNRQVTEAATRTLLNQKFQDPMLGLLVAHLLLRDTPEDPVLKQVIENLSRLLGVEHPDVQALVLAASEPAASEPGGPIVVTQMPMLRASWDVIVTRTVNQPSLLSENSPAAWASTRVLPSAPWLVWEAASTPTMQRTDFKMAALRSYVHRASEPASPSLMRSAPPAIMRGSFSPGPPVLLSTEEREELTRSLGVPSSVLDQMLSRLNE